MEKSNEWYTPPYIIDAAREVMGGIELDPASCAMAQETVRADRYYSKEDDGLSQEWKARTVWLNPPFGKDYGSLDAWIDKLINECKSGNARTSIALLPSSIHTSGFHSLCGYPICFTRKRVRFIRPYEDQCQSNLYGNVFVYLGSNEQKFIEVFSKLGTVVKRVS